MIVDSPEGVPYPEEFSVFMEDGVTPKYKPWKKFITFLLFLFN